MLQDEQTAQLFEHYLRVLAPWYDLNDLENAFTRTVGARARECHLILHAILAFAAIHKCRTGQSSLKTMAEVQHARCLRHLIELRKGDALIEDGTALSATCLLRSYELLSGQSF